MRRSLAAVLVAAVSSTAVVLPVVSLPAAAAKPVSTEVRTTDVELPRGPGAEPAADAVSAVHEPGPFSLVGLKWSAEDRGPLDVVLRTRGEDGRWQEWSSLEVTDAAPTGSVLTTEPLYVGPSTAAQVRVRGRRPDDLQLVTVDPGTAPADAAPAGAGVLGGSAATASASAAQPAIIRRADWGADESLRLNKCGGSVSYAKTLRAATVHHTAGSNSYTASQSASIVRGIYAYHVQGNGWCDIGYNFLVDKYGQVFEGRYGGIDRPVVGAHAANYNTGTVGISVLGEYGSASLPSVAAEALARTLAWKFSLHRIDATASVTLTNGSTGEQRTVGTIHGHRDVGSTACPGVNIYSQLPSLRSRVKAITGSYSPFGSLDSVTTGFESVRISGWAIEPGNSQPIQVHAYLGTAGTALLADRPRPDVGAAYPYYGPDHGFDHVLTASPGTHDLCVYAISSAGASPTTLGCRKVTVASSTGPPVGRLEVSSAGTGSVAVSGWAFDPDSAAPIQVHAYVNGRGTAMLADRPRPDIASAYASRDEAMGFQRSWLAGVGTHEVCVYAINVGAGENTLLGCPKITVTSAPPIGSLDGVTAGPQSVVVSGWAVDPGTAAPIQVHAYVGPVGRPVPADLLRTDVGNVYPEVGPRHGYRGTVPASAGRQEVCVYAIAASGKGPNPLLGCRVVEVPTGPPTGSLDSAVAAPGGIRLAGWALDPDTADPIQVHAYVDGRGVAVVADAPRPDVGAAYPGWGSRHGYVAHVPASPGSREVCVYAIDVGGNQNRLLGCRRVTVLSGDPLGSLDGVAAVTGGVRISGWAFDPDSGGAVQVHAYVDAAGTAMLGDQPRPDVGAAYPGYGSNRGYVRTLPAAPGSRRVCVYAINVGPGATRELGCRSVTVR